MSLKMLDSNLYTTLRNYEEIEIGSVRELNSSYKKSWFVTVYYNDTKYTVSRVCGRYEVQKNARNIIVKDGSRGDVIKAIKGGGHA